MGEFDLLKLRGKYSRLPPPPQYIVYKISDDKKFIEIDCKGEKGASFDEFVKKLPEEDCRYAVLDVEVETSSGAKNNKIVFISWSDDNAPIKTKFLYSSSSNNFKKNLSGVKEYAAHSMADLDLAEIKKSV